MGGNTTCMDCAHYSVCSRAGKKCDDYMSGAVVDGLLKNTCLFNEGVICHKHDSLDQCEGCGWYPVEVANRRQEIRRMAARGETPHVSL